MKKPSGVTILNPVLEVVTYEVRGSTYGVS